VAAGSTGPEPGEDAGAVAGAEFADSADPAMGRGAAGVVGVLGFVSSVCFDMTTVVVFCILSCSWCSDGDFGGTVVKASAARTISST